MRFLHVKLESSIIHSSIEFSRQDEQSSTTFFIITEITPFIVHMRTFFIILQPTQPQMEKVCQPIVIDAKTATTPSMHFTQ